ncbi:hypothetical protein PF005_g26423 [Phytophthora fragariae]|uniref:CBM1 domain-containing protein n=1 Tax=Phytophthora fragariae TaxID=53985 RepID=A0A6A3HPS9_9STRA|nr:hypothetical protein PF009_g27639 [Phytophthora fragariae]KAE8971367.1 hypothetical protein PF011_g26059 [Phytophthora fragariae]KAE9071600.1 hypothetical protein PF010_g25815 [Phytophthora fragariae]KAE9084212.1 hypothetical protein PF006_g26520 [Phytophthora fragariae]KAE9173093.1 hypothetical protein PF005_g26423 [Phytophthora fragariae]
MLKVIVLGLVALATTHVDASVALNNTDCSWTHVDASVALNNTDCSWVPPTCLPTALCESTGDAAEPCRVKDNVDYYPQQLHFAYAAQSGSETPRTP